MAHRFDIVPGDEINPFWPSDTYGDIDLDALWLR